MIRFKQSIRTPKDRFQEIEYNSKVIGSIYESFEKSYVIYQTLVPALEFYKKKYEYGQEEYGYMFLYFESLSDLLQFHKIKDLD